MLESRPDPAFQWMTRLAREHPGIFGRGGGWKVSSLKEPQVSSHSTRLFKVDGTVVHVKYFSRTLGHTGATYRPAREMEAEYRALKTFEERGFTSGRYQVVRALGYDEKSDCALATLFVEGESLLSLIAGAIDGERSEADLFMGLELAAGLLKKIHDVMPQSFGIDHCEMFYSYLKALLNLEGRDALSGYHRRIMKALARWQDSRPLLDQRGVTVHGDANPSNFKIREGIIYAFDVERSRPRRSRCVDLGAMVAELTHQFAYLGRDAARAGPFIGHFLRAYEPLDRERKRIEQILPFYTSQSLLKIAMLGYWNGAHRRFLVEEGARQIEVPPR